MREQEEIACPLCGHAVTRQLHLLSDVVHRTPGEWPLLECQECRLLYLSPRPTEEAILAYYPDSYGPYQGEGSGLVGRLRGAWRMWQQRPRVMALLATRPPGTRLLDLGCGTGLLVQAFSELGWDASGQEVNEQVAERARERGLTIYDRPLEMLALPSESLDAVTMFDVLEHLHDPRRTLREIRRLLAPDGVLLAAVPNAASLDRRLFGRWWIGFDAPRHLTVFTPDTLRRMVEEAGLRVERIYSFYGRYTVFALSVRGWLRDHMAEGKARDMLERLLFLPLWRWLSYPLFRLIEGAGYGSIITVVARRTE